MAGIRPWLTLLRPPNLLTVPGDVLAGYLLAVGAAGGLVDLRLAGAAVVSLCFYAAGLLLNDWADAEVDRRERPERPVPAGLISENVVFLAGAGLVAAGLLLCLLIGRPVLIIGASLAVAIANYNLLTKGLVLIGAFNMGLCRALNLLLGASVAVGVEMSPLVMWGAGTLLVYVAAVSHLARREMAGRYFVVERWLPAIVLVAAFLLYLPLSPLIYWPSQVFLPLLFLLAAISAGRVAVQLPDRQGRTPGEGVRLPVPVPVLIGRLIGLLIPVQSAFIVGSGDQGWRLAFAAAVLALWPLKRWMAGYFYSS